MLISLLWFYQFLKSIHLPCEMPLPQQLTVLLQLQVVWQVTHVIQQYPLTHYLDLLELAPMHQSDQILFLTVQFLSAVNLLVKLFRT